MNEQLQDQLRKKYPSITLVDDHNKLSSFALFGFEIGDGWYKPLASAFDRLQERLEAGAFVRLTQVKEKYGTLRIYVSTNDDTCDEIADEAEDRSSKICELCGEPGCLVRRSGWYSTLCPTHSKS